MNRAIKDEIARLRAEKRHFLELAAQARETARNLKAAPIGQKDPIALLRSQDRMRETAPARAYATNALPNGRRNWVSPRPRGGQTWVTWATTGAT